MRQPYWEWQDRKVKDKITWLLPERTRTNNYWLEAYQVESYSMSLLPTHQRVCERRRIVWCHRRKWRGILIRAGWEMRKNSTVRRTTATMNLFSTIWMRRVTLHHSLSRLCFHWQFSSYPMTKYVRLSYRRGRIMKSSTVNVGESKDSKPHCKGGKRKCSVVATKLLPPPPLEDK